MNIEDILKETWQDMFNYIKNASVDEKAGSNEKSRAIKYYLNYFIDFICFTFRDNKIKLLIQEISDLIESTSIELSLRRINPDNYPKDYSEVLFEDTIVKLREKVVNYLGDDEEKKYLFAYKLQEILNYLEAIARSPYGNYETEDDRFDMLHNFTTAKNDIVVLMDLQKMKGKE